MKSKRIITIALTLLLFIMPLAALVSAATASSSPMTAFTYGFGSSSGLPAPFNFAGAGYYYSFTYDGNIAYCLDRANQNPDGSQDTVMSISSLSAEQLQRIRLILLYGYDGNTKYGYSADIERVATQICIWQIAHGLINNSDFLSYAITGTYSGDVLTVVGRIYEQMFNHSTRPSFTRSTTSLAVTYEATYNPDTELHEITLTDTTGVLQYYNLVSVLQGMGYTASRSGNTLRISSPTPFENVLVSGRRTSNTYTSSSVFLIRDIAYATGNGVQDKVFVYGSRTAPDPVLAYFRLNSPYGNIVINKTDTDIADHPIQGAVFEVYTKDDVLVGTITTNSSGVARLNQLELGDYYFFERSPASGYIPNDTRYDLTVRPGNNVRNIQNTHYGSLVINKTDLEIEGLVVEGAVFDVFNEDDELVGTITTDEYGVARLDELLPGDYYFIEKEPAFGYIPNEQRYDVTLVPYDNEYEVFNEYKKGNLELTKYSAFDGKPLQGASYGLYRASDDELLEMLVTDEYGKAESDSYRFDTYYLKEEIPPNRYYIDLNEHHIVLGEVNGSTSDFPTTDEAIIGMFSAMYMAPSSAQLYIANSGMNVPNTGTEYEVTDDEKLGYPEVPQFTEQNSGKEEYLSIIYLREEDKALDRHIVDWEFPAQKDNTKVLTYVYTIIIILVGVGILYLIYKKNKSITKYVSSFVLILLVLISSVGAHISKAETVKDVNLKESGTTVTVEYDGLTEEDVPETYMYRHTDGQIYELPLIAVTYDEGTLTNRTDTVRATIDYGWEEYIPKPQQQMTVSHYDKLSGQTITGAIYLYATVQKEPFQWLKSNDAPAVFEGYQSAYYLMKNTKDVYIPYNDKRPAIDDFKEKIVTALGYDSERVRITDAKWDGKVYTEKGTEKRNAIFTTERYVAQYLAMYEAVWDMPDAPGIRGKAVYGSSDLDLTVKQPEDSNPEPVTPEAVTIDLLPDVIPQAKMSTSTIILISVGAFILILAAVLIMLVLAKKRRQREAEPDDDSNVLHISGTG
ncbi:MAG: SpaA isopeptide-forming pilin-related protein [Oscillospiraceae bacterium]|nr:SpaA isopeptide-forming pilin-related protein [Oscillospiraceae bacterium]